MEAIGFYKGESIMAVQSVLQVVCITNNQNYDKILERDWLSQADLGTNRTVYA